MNTEDKKKLEHIVERVAELERQKKELGEEVKELCDEAKGKLGVSVKATKQLAKEKNMDEIERLGQRLLEEEIDNCRAALGMIADLPLGMSATARLEEGGKTQGKKRGSMKDFATV